MTIIDIYYEQHSVPDGLKLFKRSKSTSELLKLVIHYLSQGRALRCWCCQREVNAVITMQAKKDPAVFNTFAHIDGCLVERYSVDHIIPKAFGGVDRMENYRLSCVKCNHTRDINMSDAEIMFLSSNQHLCKDGKKVYNNVRPNINQHYFHTTVQHYDQAHYAY